MCWNPSYVVLIFFSTLVSYITAIQMGKAVSKQKRKGYLIAGLVANLSVLFFYKYFNFINDSVGAIFDRFDVFYGVSGFEVLLPIGISFYTFQTLSYIIDVYRGEKEPEKHLGVFALYVSFFPQLVAGPIERSTRLLPQFYKKFDFDYDRVSDGLKLVLWGLFKKVVIADRLAIYVNEVFNNPGDYQGIPVILACYFFAFQIYCDFSGYTDIAIGSSKVMGFDLMDNFKRPYFSKSISEFWRRWHISLSTWFRDYLYIPLGGNKVGRWRWHYNILVVFILSGLWHGANWTFVVWGALHGFYMLFAVWTKSIREKFIMLVGLNNYTIVHKYLKVLITFHLVTFAWIFFRANSIPDAFVIAGSLFKVDISGSLLVAGVSHFGLVLSLLLIGFLVFIHSIERHEDIRQFLSKKPAWFRYAIYYILLMGIALLGVFEAAFIYFQF